jgi:molybdopterin/thiamine biosynthesis adenylyltransferase
MNYNTIFSRNIGLITHEQQNKIKNSKILICGVGGMGGVAAEILVRMGVSNLKIIDPDVFDIVNLNRQLYSNLSTIGNFKVLVLKENFLKINPNLNIQAFPEPVSEENISNLLSDVDIVINGMDQFLPSIILERLAHKKNIPIIDAWITPFASVFVIKGQDPHWEDYLNLKTKNKKIIEISKEDLIDNLKTEVTHTLSHFNPFDFVEPQLVDDVINGKIPRPSFPIVVFLSGTLMANEAFKLICGYQTTTFKGIFFNQYTYEIKHL